MRMAWRTVAALCRIVCLGMTVGWAQGGTAVLAQDGVALAGVVVDEQGLVLPGTGVELRLPDRTFVASTLVGRAVRQPTVAERYSDRFPATKFQVAAEFMGNPGLVAEESLELNVGTVWRIAEATLGGDFFYRNIDNYITVLADPTLSRRLPLSPSVVYRHINGEQARFTGYDLKAESALGIHVGIRGGWTYVWAEDTFADEPLFGIAPFEQRYAVQLHTANRRQWVECLVTNAAEQNRVASSRFERPTDGWTTLDILAGLALVEQLTLKVGLENLTDEFYATHVNSLDPFTGERIAEIGRSLYIGAEYGF